MRWLVEVMAIIGPVLHDNTGARVFGVRILGVDDTGYVGEGTIQEMDAIEPEIVFS